MEGLHTDCYMMPIDLFQCLWSSPCNPPSLTHPFRLSYLAYSSASCWGSFSAYCSAYYSALNIPYRANNCVCIISCNCSICSYSKCRLHNGKVCAQAVLVQESALLPNSGMYVHILYLDRQIDRYNYCYISFFRAGVTCLQTLPSDLQSVNMLLLLEAISYT